MKNTIFSLLLMGLISTVASCSANDDMAFLSGSGQGNGNKAVLTGNACLDSMPFETLSHGEIDALILMREEELLARDVYMFFAGLYSPAIFSNISSSEQQHTDMVALLLQKYSLTDPAVNHQVGVFSDTSLQAYYNSLTQAGSASLLDAMIVGATIEDLDIYDLDHLAGSVIDNQDITWVFGNLERGSRNHLRSFYSQISKRGGVYAPQFINQTYFDQIVNSSHETGTGCP